MTTPAADDSTRHPPPPLPGADAPVRIAGVRLTSQLIGGALVVAGALLPWTSQYLSSTSAFGVPLRVLVDPDPNATGLVKLAFLLVPLGMLVLASGLRVLPAAIGQAAGGAAALVVVVFVAQLQRSMGKFYAATVFGILGIGVYVTLLGGAIAVVARGDRSGASER